MRSAYCESRSRGLISREVAKQIEEPCSEQGRDNVKQVSSEYEMLIDTMSFCADDKDHIV